MTGDGQLARVAGTEPSGSDGQGDRVIQESFDNAGVAYLEQLLRAALLGEVAHNEPEAGRIVASLMMALVSQGAGDRVEHYLSLTPYCASLYEVTCFDPDDRPVSRIENLDAGQAIRIVAALAISRPDDTAAVIARDNSGHQRCVLVANGSGISFQFPARGVSDAHSLESREDDARTEELARAVDAELDGSLAVQHGQDIAAVLNSMIPSAADIADLVVKRLSGGLGSYTGPTRLSGESGFGCEAAGDGVAR